MGIRGDVNSCRKIPPEIRNLIREAHEKKKADKDAYATELHEDDDEEEEVQEIHSIRSGKRSETSSMGNAIAAAKQGKSVKGPLDLLFFRNQKKQSNWGRLRSKQA